LSPTSSEPDPDPELLVLARRAGGSPFLLVELVSGLAEEGLVRVEHGRAVLGDARLPARFRGTMRDRLARLSPPARRAVTVASVLGRRFSVDSIAAMRWHGLGHAAAGRGVA
jgi:predicted ATPase